MGAPSKRPSIWVRANPHKLSPEELADIRATRHLTDLALTRTSYRALIRAGHRYAGELAYLTPAAVRALPLMDDRLYRNVYMTLHGVGVVIGSRARERVHVPQ